MDNYKASVQYIQDKYKTSNKWYKKKFTNEDRKDMFYIAYESMNVYPTYPRPIITSIKKAKDKFKIKKHINSNFKMDQTNTQELNRQVDEKITEYVNYEKLVIKQRGLPKVRRYFDYEVRDLISRKYMKDTYITNAWIKMYEILSTYNYFENHQSPIIKTFHICEHPGAFIYATRDFIKKRYPDKKHDFIFQSLKPIKKTIFKTEHKLFKENRDKLDYGADGTGDITTISNILHYRKKHQNKKFNLITSDCGLKCSDDFIKQEETLLPIFFGALLCAIGVATKGTDYIWKMFSFNLQKTIEMIYLGCYFFESADIIRLMTTKSTSGEIYIVFKNFRFEDNNPKFEKVFNDIITYYKNYKDNINFINDIDKKFMKRTSRSSNLLNMRRIISINQLIFRTINQKYVEKHGEIRDFVQGLTDYYAKYYARYVKLRGIKKK